MAKQKKKKKKIKQAELPKKDKVLYFIISNFPTALVFVLSILGSIYFKKIIIKLFYDENILYSEPLTNGFTVLSFLLLFLFMASGLVHYFTLTSLNISFKDYVKRKSDKGRKTLKFSAIYFTVLCIVFGVCASFQIYSRRDADTDKIYNNHLIAADTVTEYEEIDSAELYVKYNHNIWSVRHSTISYDAIISVEINGKQIKFRDSYFDQDYTAMQDFIECVGADKVKIDTENLDRLLDNRDDSVQNDIKRLFCAE